MQSQTDAPLSELPARRARLLNPKRLAVAAVLVGAVFAALAYFEADEPTQDDGVLVASARLLETPPGKNRQLKVFAEKGSLAPDFEATRLEGGRLRLSDLRGSPVILKFWATWCASCLAEFPHVRDLQQRYAAEGLHVVALNAGQSREEAKEFADFLDAPFDWALDPDLNVTDGYRVIGFPISVFIDRDGVIRGLHVGQMSAELIEAFTRAAIDAVPAPNPPPSLGLPLGVVGRENVLIVLKSGSKEGQLSFASRSLRCDPVYCRNDIPASLEKNPAIRYAVLDRRAETPLLRVFFEPAALTDDQVIEAVKQVLSAEPDPLYEGPLVVRREQTAGTEP